MTKAIVKKQTSIQKEFNPQDMRSKVLSNGSTDHEPNTILRKLDTKLSQLGVKKLDLTKDEEMKKLFDGAFMALGLDNHHALIWGIITDYRPLAIEFADNLAKEYECKTPGEKALSQVVVNSYIRVLDDTRRYIGCADGGQYLSTERTNHLAVLSKQMDRSNRQFISALTALKQIKSPPIQITVKTNTAFIAQNQQLNNNPNETNNP